MVFWLTGNWIVAEKYFSRMKYFSSCSGRNNPFAISLILLKPKGFFRVIKVNPSTLGRHTLCKNPFRPCFVQKLFECREPRVGTVLTQHFFVGNTP